jgi:hypothetical protein
VNLENGDRTRFDSYTEAEQYARELFRETVGVVICTSRKVERPTGAAIVLDEVIALLSDSPDITIYRSTD